MRPLPAVFHALGLRFGWLKEFTSNDEEVAAVAIGVERVDNGRREAARRFVSPPRHELDRLRTPLSDAERRVFDFFDDELASEWEIYVQPHLNGLRPDFVLLNPQVGIAVFEVKAWDVGSGRYSVAPSANGAPQFSVRTFEGRRQIENPIEKLHLYRSEIAQLYCPGLGTKAGLAAVTAGIIVPTASQEEVVRLLAQALDYRIQDPAALTYFRIVGREALTAGGLAQVFPDSARRTSQLMTPAIADDLRHWLVEPDFAAEQRDPGPWVNLEYSYRMPTSLTSLARRFVEMYLPKSDSPLPRAPAQQELDVDISQLRWYQVRPEDFSSACVNAIMQMVAESHSDGRDWSLAFADVVFLCDRRPFGREVSRLLEERGVTIAGTYAEDGHEQTQQKRHFFKGDARVKGTTIHSFKGWEGRSLVVGVAAAGTDHGRSLVYSGITRLKAHPRGSYLTVVCAAPEFAAFGELWPTDGLKSVDSRARLVADARTHHARAYEAWDDKEEARLRELFASGAPVNVIAEQLRRHPGAIRSRLRKLKHGD